MSWFTDPVRPALSKWSASILNLTSAHLLTVWTEGSVPHWWLRFRLEYRLHSDSEVGVLALFGNLFVTGHHFVKDIDSYINTVTVINILQGQVHVFTSLLCLKSVSVSMETFALHTQLSRCSVWQLLNKGRQRIEKQTEMWRDQKVTAWTSSDRSLPFSSSFSSYLASAPLCLSDRMDVSWCEKKKGL